MTRLGVLVGALALVSLVPLPAVGLTGPPEAAPARAVAQHQEFYWDFSDCFDLTVRTAGTEFIPGDQYSLPGGCFLRFGDPGQSWLEATFTLNSDPLSGAGARGGWGLVMFHLAPAPDERTRGYAPVRVTLNNQEVWQGSPADEGRNGPGRVWDSAEVAVSRVLQRGRNTLRFEFLTGAVSPYWLKVVYVAWESQ